MKCLSVLVLISILFSVGCTDTNEQEKHLKKICTEGSCQELSLLDNVCYDSRQSVIAYETEHLNTMTDVKNSFDKQKFFSLVDEHIACLESELENVGLFKSTIRGTIMNEIKFAKSRKSSRLYTEN